jgi:hypothetical protein
MQDIEEGWISGANQAIAKYVWVWGATLSRNSIHTFNVL